eukprot:GEMP01047675.1.p1 GENE.GEMP01047675.1~~GEMP01047675.1.p1  ORF type:complete len:158 (+),score=31.94 GEMP01047675.1:150-623(+)
MTQRHIHFKFMTVFSIRITLTSESPPLRKSASFAEETARSIVAVAVCLVLTVLPTVGMYLADVFIYEALYGTDTSRRTSLVRMVALVYGGVYPGLYSVGGLYVFWLYKSYHEYERQIEEMRKVDDGDASEDAAEMIAEDTGKDGQLVAEDTSGEGTQ